MDALYSGQFSFLLLIVLGFIIARLGMDSAVFDMIPQILFTICYPALILESISAIDFTLLLSHGTYAAVFSLVSTLAIVLLTRLALRRYKNALRREIIIFCMSIGNLTFIGVPFVQYFFGPVGLAVALIYGGAQDVLIWSVGYGMFAKQRGARGFFKALINPCFICLVISLVLAVFRIGIPPYLDGPVSMLAQMTTPLALVCVGGILSQYIGGLKRIDRGQLVFALSRTLIMPTAVFCILLLLGSTATWAFFYAFLSALPAPIMSVMLSKKFDRDVRFAAVNFVVTTLLFLALCVAVFAAQAAGLVSLTV